MVKALVTMVGLLLVGCTMLSQPPRPFTAEALAQSGGVAYLWSAGKTRQPVVSMQDFAVVTRIDDREIPSEYRPDAGMEPGVAWRIEIPAGTRVVQILNKECSLLQLTYFGGCTAVEKATEPVEFPAAPGRAYTPVVDEKCGRKWFWIADSSDIVPAATGKISPLPFIGQAPAAGGVKPPAGPCPAHDATPADSR